MKIYLRPYGDWWSNPPVNLKIRKEVFVMMNFYFKTSAGKVFVGCGKDIDRARSDAKRKAGSDWHPSAKCFKVGNAI